MGNRIEDNSGAEDKPRILLWNPEIFVATTSEDETTEFVTGDSMAMNYAIFYLTEWLCESEDIFLDTKSSIKGLFFGCMQKFKIQGVIALDPCPLIDSIEGCTSLNEILTKVSDELLRPEGASMFFDWFNKTPIYTINPHQAIAAADLRTGLDKWMEEHFGLTPPPKLIELIANATNGDEDKVNPNKETMPDGQPIH